MFSSENEDSLKPGNNPSEVVIIGNSFHMRYNDDTPWISGQPHAFNVPLHEVIIENRSLIQFICVR